MKTLKEIEIMAHNAYPYGSEEPIGSGLRSLYEVKKESFIKGYNCAQLKS